MPIPQDTLLFALQSADENIVVEALRGCGEADALRVKDKIFGLLTHPHARIRDAAAMAAVDLNLTEAVPVLVRLINDPRYLNERGTLVYALQHFDCGEHADVFANCIAEGSYETVEMGLQAIESLTSVHPDPAERAMQILRGRRDHMDESDFRFQYVNRALELIPNIPRF